MPKRAAFDCSGTSDDSLRALWLVVGSFLKRNTLIVLKDSSGTRSVIDIKMSDSTELESLFSTSYLISAMACSTNYSMNYFCQGYAWSVYLMMYAPCSRLEQGGRAMSRRMRRMIWSLYASLRSLEYSFSAPYNLDASTIFFFFKSTFNFIIQRNL